MFGVVTDVVLLVLTGIGAVGTAVGAYVAILQHRGKQAEGARADQAEEARDRMADQLAGAREELARSSAAHEQIAATEIEAASNEHRAARDALREQKKQNSATEKTARDSLAEQKRQARKDATARKKQDAKVLAEQKKQTKAAEKLAKEARRKK